jgi:hypothetical protein
LNAQTIWLAIKSMKWYQKKLKRHSSIIKLLPNVTMIEKRKNFYFIWLFLHAGLNFLCLPVSRVFFYFLRCHWPRDTIESSAKKTKKQIDICTQVERRRRKKRILCLSAGFLIVVGSTARWICASL